MYYTGAELYNIVKNNIYKIPHDIDGVIAIARGGLFPGFIIAEHLNIPITTVDKYIENRETCWLEESTVIKFNPTLRHKLLLIDDSISSGNSMQIALNKLSLYDDIKIITCVIHSSIPFEGIILDNDIPGIRLYEFNLFRTNIFRNAITDLDGVLCKDPDWGLDTNEEEYLNFINNTSPYLSIPYIDTILTSRLERYRYQTEEWLKKNKISYNKLIMSPLDNIDEKLKLMHEGKWNDADWKCDQYKSICNIQQWIPIMIESNNYDAHYIKSHYDKAIVFCTDTNNFV